MRGVQYLRRRVTNVFDIVKFTFGTIQAKWHQNHYALAPLQNAETVVVIFAPSRCKINGGIMSLYDIAYQTREVLPDAFVAIATYTGDWVTYSRNRMFHNEEMVLRWEQIRRNAVGAKRLILHLPEEFVPAFLRNLLPEDRAFFSGIPDFRINILNQNIEFMPTPKTVARLLTLTPTVSQTTAHPRYATQEVCNLYRVPQSWLGARARLNCYRAYTLEERERIFLYSPDPNPHKKRILALLKRAFPDFRQIMVWKMPFSRYVDLASKSLFSITFGEGCDYYLSIPSARDGVSFAVHNEQFFPAGKDWLSLCNIFPSYEAMETEIVERVKRLLTDRELYLKTARTTHAWLGIAEESQAEKDYRIRLARFYRQDYDFVPERQ